MTSGVARLFVVVYAREVFNQSDGLVALYTVFGGLGTSIIGLLIKFFVDRIGAKPIYMFTVACGLVSMVPVLIFSPNLTPFSTIIYLAVLFFVMNFAFIGAENIGQTYFIGLSPAQYMLQLGVVYYLLFGAAGAAGSYLGGLFLDVLHNHGIDVTLSYRALFLMLILVAATVLFLQRALKPLGALSVKDSLAVALSSNDRRAISLLDKLEKTTDSTQEEALLSELHDSPSPLALGGLLERVKSPRFEVRMESLRAIGALKRLNPNAEQALIDDVAENPYTTAYYSARILGSHKVERAAPLLEEVVASDDYMLAGEAMIALARLGDTDFRVRIEQLTVKSGNPRLRLMGTEALGIFKNPESFPVLIENMLVENPPPYLRDETALALAEILNIPRFYYKLLVRFLADQSMAATLAEDEAESAVEAYNTAYKRSFHKTIEPGSEREKLHQAALSLQGAVHGYMAGEPEGQAALSRWILELPDGCCDESLRLMLADLVFDEHISQFDRIRLLIVQWCARQLRVWMRRR
jgi:hypothetical protein